MIKCIVARVRCCDTCVRKQSKTEKKIFMTNRYILRHAVLMLFALAYGACCMAFDTSIYAEQSRLAQGKWVKIKVSESGVYKITQSDARKWGFSDISKLRIYGYGGAPIPEVLTRSAYVDDVPQVQVLRDKNAIYFYAQGPITWKAGRNITYQQVQHPYSTAGYYFLSEEADEADVEIVKATNEISASGDVVKTFTDRLYHEKELMTASESGRQLLGEDFRFNSNQTFKFQIPDYVSGSDVNVLTSFGAHSQGGGASRLSFKYNGTQLGANSKSDMIDEVNSQYTHIVMTSSLKTFSLNNTDNFSYSIGLQYGGTLSVARLDYITVNYLRQLKLVNGKLSFRYNASKPVALCMDGATDNTMVWDVTDVKNIYAMNLTKTDDGVAFAPCAMGEREYVAFDTSVSLPTPEYVSVVKNQNVHGEQVPDMIIISPKEFVAQARRVASLHETNDGMRVLVLDSETVYNEFSSGVPDAMSYRNLCKMFYDRGIDSEGHKLKYLLLFGRGTYDNRQLTDVVRANSYPMLLTYQSEESSNEYTSYTADDLFVFLEDNAGGNIVNAKLSIAVGRMPVKSVEEARTVVDKLYKYVNGVDYGAWKSVATIVADDQNNSEHVRQAESVIKLYSENGAADMQFNKIYIDAYDNASSGGSRVCQVGRDKLYKQFDEGMMWLGYIGHANPTSWTGEHLLTWYDINNFYNKRWPFLFAATCEFSRFDADAVSGGEIMYLNGNGGVIAELSATRIAYIPNNGTLNDAIAKYAFSHDADGKRYTIGEFVRRGKNDVVDDNRLRYTLFGDPAMRLRMPEYKVRLEAINGHAIDDNLPTFQARQTLTFLGSIVDGSGAEVTDFNGNIVSTLYDAEQSVVTLGYGEDGSQYPFQDRSNKLALVTDSVKNGKFSVKVTIPSELSASSFDNYSPARMCMYAYCAASGAEAVGSNDEFYIYGYDETIETDSDGPEIRSFALNSENFKDGDNVNESPLVIASIFDKDGINFSSGGIGHDITLQLDGKETHSDVSSYFSPVYDKDGNAGTISYPLSGLEEGEHTLRLKVWDVFNNSSEKTISFNVVKGLKPEIYDVYTTANPAIEDAVFYLKHNRPDALLTITLQVYDLMGKEVWSISQTGKSDLYTSFPITWGLCDKSGGRVPRGIYVYRASISTDGEQYTTKSKKLAVAGE